VTETRRLAVIARRRARGRGAKAKLKAAARIEELADRCRGREPDLLGADRL
jgi:hypothetical protein